MYPNVKIEMHLLQNVAPSCLNRDENNAPKDCDFGGVRRARISSQSFKRAIRHSALFSDAMKDHLSIRSLRFPAQVKDRLLERGLDDHAARAVGKALEKIAMKPKKEEENKDNIEDGDDAGINKTPQIMFFTNEEIDSCARIVEGMLADGVSPDDIIDTKRRKFRDGSILPQPSTVDIALFGRMITSNAFVNIDAACQVAHAISTNRVDREFDFYTAVDDLNPAEETGAGMMGVTEYNSACFYRYALIDRAQLMTNLNGDAELCDRVIHAFLQAAVTSLPTGKQNTFAAHNPPSFGMFVVRRDGCPCSLANAFAQPVHVVLDKDEDIVGRSIVALGKYYTEYKKVYGSDDIRGESLFHLDQENRLDGLKEFDAGSVKAAIDQVMASIGATAQEE